MSLYQQSILAEKAQYALDVAKRLGAEQAQVVLSESLGESVSWRNQMVENITRERDLGFSLLVYKEQREGSASISDWDKSAIDNAVAAAINASNYNEADEHNGLPDAKDYAVPNEQLLAQLDLIDDKSLALNALETIAQEIEMAALDYDNRIIMSDGTQVTNYCNQFFLATSNGFAQGYQGSRQQRSISVLARNSQSQQTSFDYDVCRHIEDCRQPQMIGQTAAQKALAKLSPQKITGGRYPVLFDASVSTSLIGHLLQGLSGTMQYRHLSFLNDCLGEVILPAWLNIVENPHIPRALYSAPFDAQGLPTQTSAIIKEGTIEKYLLDVYSARRLHLKPTANAGGVRNARFVAPNDYVADPQVIYRQMGSGVVITQLMGQGVNMLTGDYSRGASGFWVENGEISHPIEGITIAGNLKNMLNDIVMLGNDIDYRGRLQLPSILLESMIVAQ